MLIHSHSRAAGGGIHYFVWLCGEGQQGEAIERKEREMKKGTVGK